MKKKSILSCFVISVFWVSLAAGGGGVVNGGGGGAEADAKLLLGKIITDDSYNLKASIIYYLNHIVIDQIADPMVKATIQRIGRKALIDDVNRSQYNLVKEANEAYVPELGEKSGYKMQPAAVTDYVLGADVNFDLDLLWDQVKNWSTEERMIAVGALALHEHIHHFQKRPLTESEKYDSELEAYQMSGYVQFTAKFLQVPLFTWSPTPKANTENHYKNFGPFVTFRTYSRYTNPDTGERRKRESRRATEIVSVNFAHTGPANQIEIWLSGYNNHFRVPFKTRDSALKFLKMVRNSVECINLAVNEKDLRKANSEKAFVYPSDIKIENCSEENLYQL